MASEKLQRTLRFTDVFFLSFGGQSPLLSLLTYGAVVLTFAGFFAPIVLLMATVIVVINGLVILRLSRRFTSTGGYYIYAMRTLSERTGFQTGWMYLFYSVLFGSAYVVGAAFVINFVLGLNPVLIVLALSIPAVIFLITGVNPSAKYAIIAGTFEIAAILSMFAISIYLAGGHVYSPVLSYQGLSSGDVALAVLFAMGIPTGYGAIAPISGEIVNAHRTVGRVAISVIISGGLLAAVFIYGVANLLVFRGIPVSGLHSSLGIIYAIKSMFGQYSGDILDILILGAINDGILAVLSFSVAASRTLYKMSSDGPVPDFFSKLRGKQPMNANMAVGAGMIVIPALATLIAPPSLGFIVLGTVSVFGGLFIHLTANFSLLRVGMRKFRRTIGRKAKFLQKLKGGKEITLALVAILLSGLDLVYSILSTNTIYGLFFLAWIVVGYLILDVREIVLRTPLMSTKTNLVDNLMNQKLKGIDAMGVRSVLPDVTVNLDDSMKDAIDKCMKMDSPGAIVLDKHGRAAGTLELRKLVSLSDEEVSSMKVQDFDLGKVVKVSPTEPASRLAEIFRTDHIPLLAIVDRDGTFMGTIREVEILRKTLT
ncbi:MAG: amino acid permease [Thermoplasmataceae archaeon]